MKSKDAGVAGVVQQHRLVPRLRFPEFSEAGEWQKEPLRVFATIINDRVGDRSCTPLSITSGVGLVTQKEKFGRTIAGKQLKNYVVLRHGDFAYNKSATKESPQGFIATYSGHEPAAVPNSIFTCFRVQESKLSSSYLRHLFGGNLHGKWLSKYITVGARAHGSLNIDDEDLLSLPVPQPVGRLALAEQKRIADCLSSIDVLIAAEARKLGALKAYKKGLMQQLFPAEGETIPRLRFPAFADAPDWVVEALGKVASYENGKAYEQHVVEQGKYVVVNARFISTDGRVKKFSNAQFCLALIGDVLIVLSDLPKGKALAKCFLVNSNDLYAVNQRVARITPKEMDSRFLFLILDRARFLLAFDDGLNQTHLAKDSVLACPIPHPQEKGEQSSIADCLSSLDELMGARSRKIDALKAHRKGLMQQLFPVLDEVHG